MTDNISYLSNASLITLGIILANLIGFLLLPILVAYYMKCRFSETQTVETTVS